MSEYEAVIDEIGSFGPAQIQVFILVSLFEAPVAWGLLVHPVFASRKVPWSCAYDNGTGGLGGFDSPSNATSWLEGNCTLLEMSQCGSVIFSTEYSSVVSEWTMICNRSHLASLITTVQMVGGFIGAFISGQLSDIYGRKKILISVYAVYCLSGLWSAFANSWILYLVLKFIVGATVSGTMVVNFALTMEFVTPEWRTFCGTVGFWNIGVMLMALIGFLVPNWRYMTMTCSLLGLPLLACWWFIPESPRWLLLKGRRKEAEAILSNMAKRNSRPEPDFSKLQIFIQKQQNIRDESRKYTYWDLCRNFQMTRTTATILYMWFACSCVYYGTTLGAGKLHGNIYLNLFLSGLVEIPGLLVVLAFNNRIGRRMTLCILLLIGGASCLSVLLVDLFGGIQLKWLSTMLSLIGKSGVSGAWAAVLISSAELFPTVVRNIGMASCSMSSRIGSVVAPLMANLDEFHVSIPYVIYGILGLSCGLLCLLIPETLNHPLPDTLPPGEYCSCLRGHTLSVEDVSLEEITKQSNGVVPLDRDDNGTSDNTNDKSLLNNTQVHKDEKDGML